MNPAAQAERPTLSETALRVREILKFMDMSQRRCAAVLEMPERTLRAMLAGREMCPMVVMLAVERLRQLWVDAIESRPMFRMRP